MNNMIPYIIPIRFLKRYSFIFLIAFITSHALNVSAAFDPVNDDTDIFLANPGIDANRPNVLIILDNTANWSRNVGGQPISQNELAALSNVVQNLGDEFNIGLMMYAETGGGNSGEGSGGVLRWGIRQMTSTNRTALANYVTALDDADDKSNNNTMSLAMLEAYRYYSGKANRASSGKEKADVDGSSCCTSSDTVTTPFAAGLSDFPLNNASTGTTYNSPINDQCQDSFIIYISNGPSGENSSALSVSETELSSLGFDTTNPFSISPSGQQGNWMDEWAHLMANTDMNGVASGTPHVYTYVIEVDPQTTGQNDDMTALLQSAALKGKGSYFAVSSANAGAGITNALNAIFNEIQAVNSVFAATTLPVSVNVRGTNLNQVYIGVFRPDQTKAPRWFGNLKMYELGFNTATSTLFLADSAGTVAENTTTGFIDPSAVSFHSAASSFWSYRTVEENGVGGASDSPDGDLVEKGGIAQGLRTDFPTTTLQDSDRKLYTCTSGTVTCSPGTAGTPGSSLSATPFKTTNDGLTTTSFGLGTTAVSTLTGFDNKPITELTDNKTLTALVAPGAGAATILTLSSTAISEKTATSLSTNSPVDITNITNTISSESIDDLNRGTGGSKNIATLVDNNGNFTGITTIHVAGVGSAEYNGTFSVLSVTNGGTTVTYDTGNNNPTNNPIVTGATYSITGSSVTVTTDGVHNFLDEYDVTIAGVTPSHFDGLREITSVPSPTSFVYSTGANTQLAPVTSFAGATASGPSSTAKLVFDDSTPSVPAYVNGAQTLVISGVTNETGYNGAHAGILTGAGTSTATFTYNVGSNLAIATGTIKISQGYNVTGTKDATVIVSGNHGITGVTPSGYNGTYNLTVVGNNISYTTTNVLTAATATLTASSLATPAASYGATAVATLVNHGLASGDNITVSGADVAAYNGDKLNITKIDDDTFSYLHGGVVAADVTTLPTFRLNNTNGMAIATSVGHGLTTGNTIVISDAVDAETTITDAATYNGTHSITVTGPNTFTYDLGTTKTNLQGPATGMDGNITTTTAKARVVNHGFTVGDSVAISGATPAAFNGSFTIASVPDIDNFTYTIASAQGDASGSIVASSGSGSSGELAQIVAWIRGADNQEDENNNSSSTDVRASIHGDVLHSRPAVVNYNRHNNDDDVYIFYGANDGVFRAVKGGFAQSDLSEPMPFEEAWGFIPEEFFSTLPRLRNNEPIISSNNKKPYFMDGSIGVYTKDVNDDGKLVAADGDKVWIFISNHRGGRFLYALDVSNPTDPKLLWRKSNGDTGWGELGQTWSVPNVQEIAIDKDGAASGDDDDTEVVLVFGAGYDPLVEDIDPLTITAFNDDTDGDGHLSVKVGAASYERGQGRGIFVVEAETGDILWQAGPSVANPVATHHFESVTGMDYAIPSDVVVISDRNSSTPNRAYVGDTGGNMWRVDMSDTTVSNWTVNKIASIADHTTVKPGLDDDGDPFTNFPGLRKFLFPPDVVYSDDGFDAILIGSGDREHPFDESITNRFYMFKDTNVGTSIDAGFTTITEAITTPTTLFDATSDCIQAATACSGSGDEVNSSTALSALTTARGWYITLGVGEKVVGNAVTLNNTTFFNTNVPSSQATATGSCESDLGEARQYKVRYDDASSIADQNIDGSTNASDRYTVHSGGGYLPSPVPVVVEINGEIHEGVISGVAVEQPPGTTLNTRLRKFWYKEME